MTVSNLLQSLSAIAAIGTLQSSSVGATEVFYIVARGVQAEFKGIKWACKQEAFPYGSATGDAGTCTTVITITDTTTALSSACTTTRGVFCNNMRHNQCV